jgi:hypothetical protein
MLGGGKRNDWSWADRQCHFAKGGQNLEGNRSVMEGQMMRPKTVYDPSQRIYERLAACREAAFLHLTNLDPMK